MTNRTIETEFPDFPLSGVPSNIPAWFESTHWHNDASPSWTFGGPYATVQLFVEYPDHARREGSSDRFTILAIRTETGELIGAWGSNDWTEARGVLLASRWVIGYGFGLGFNPDTRGRDYVTAHGRALTDDEANEYDKDIDEMCGCGDQYELGFYAMHAMGLINYDKGERLRSRGRSAKTPITP